MKIKAFPTPASPFLHCYFPTPNSLLFFFLKWQNPITCNRTTCNTLPLTFLTFSWVFILLLEKSLCCHHSILKAFAAADYMGFLLPSFQEMINLIMPGCRLINRDRDKLISLSRGNRTMKAQRKRPIQEWLPTNRNTLSELIRRGKERGGRGKNREDKSGQHGMHF